MSAAALSFNTPIRTKKRDWYRHHGRFQWVVFLQVLLSHLGALLAPWYFSWSALLVALGLWVATAGIGICICYHRLLTHRSFETYPWVTRSLSVIATLAIQGGPAVWVGTHRLHHQHSDRDGDPHSPKENFLWGHALWLCFFEHLDARAHASDVVDDPWMRRLDQLWFLPPILLGVLLWTIGGLPFVVWGLFVRTVFVWHITWAVNSAAHRWGYRNYDTRDDSRNNVWVAFLSFGEGWHNNHHAFPQSARHGILKWEIDPAYLFILLLQQCGLAWKVKVPGHRPLGE